tara:strand:- start:550 stop:711 length:162 start_codon:yes stop_codon:yes gene_type:complete
MSVGGCKNNRAMIEPAIDPFLEKKLSRHRLLKNLEVPNCSSNKIFKVIAETNS